MKKFISLLTLFFLLCVPTAHAQWATAGFNTVSSNPNVGAAVGTLPVANGGTSRATLTTNALLYGNGTSSVGLLAVGTGLQQIRVNAGATALEYFTPATPTTVATQLVSTIANTIYAGSAIVPLDIQRASSGSANCFQVGVNGNTVGNLFKIDYSGNIVCSALAVISGTITSGTGLICTSTSAGTVGLDITGAPAQTADFVNMQSNGGAAGSKFKVTSTGALTALSFATTDASTITMGAAGVPLLIVGHSGNGSLLLDVQRGSDNLSIFNVSPAGTNSGYRFQSVADIQAGAGLTCSSGDITATAGNTVYSTVAKGPHIKSGADGLCGSSTLVNGVKVVSTTAIGANDVVILTRTGGTITTAGQLWEVKASRSNATSFTVNSVYPLAGGSSAASATDDATFDWVIQKVD